MIIDVQANPGEAGKYRAFLDGVDVSARCYYADDEAGEVRLFKRDAMGHLIYDFATLAPAEEILHGQVRIVRRTDT